MNEQDRIERVCFVVAFCLLTVLVFFVVGFFVVCIASILVPVLIYSNPGILVVLISMIPFELLMVKKRKWLGKKMLKMVDGWQE